MYKTYSIKYTKRRRLFKNSSLDNVKYKQQIPKRNFTKKKKSKIERPNKICRTDSYSPRSIISFSLRAVHISSTKSIEVDKRRSTSPAFFFFFSSFRFGHANGIPILIAPSEVTRNKKKKKEYSNLYARGRRACPFVRAITYSMNSVRRSRGSRGGQSTTVAVIVVGADEEAFTIVIGVRSNSRDARGGCREAVGKCRCQPR